MAENSHIGWTDHTFNPWIGCTKVSPGCAHCYAETLDRNRYSKTLGGGSKAAPISHWGSGAPRHRTSTWGDPVRWNKQIWRECRACGNRWGGGVAECPSCHKEECDWVRPRVFSASLADWLDDEVPIEWLADFLQLIHDTPNLDWQLLTKRPENFHKRMADLVTEPWFEHGEQWQVLRSHLENWVIYQDAPRNVGIGTTAENQDMLDQRAIELIQIPARIRFLSCEPLLSPVDLHLFDDYVGTPEIGQCVPSGQIHWVICGGESGTKARPMHPDWARGLRDQCASAGVPFFFKQWGEFAPGWGNTMPVHQFEDGKFVARIGTKASGRTLDGVIHNAFPEVAQ